MLLAPGETENKWKLPLMGACTVHFCTELFPSGVLCFTYQLWAWNNQEASNMLDPHFDVFYFSTYKALMVLERTVGHAK